MKRKHIDMMDTYLETGFSRFSAGVLMGKPMNRIYDEPINPLIGVAGVSAVAMSARVVNKAGPETNPSDILVMHAMGPNVSGVIGSTVMAGILISIFS